MALTKKGLPMPNNSPPSDAKVGLGKIFSVFFGIGVTSFGGGLIAYVQDEVVGKQKWMSPDQFLAALEIGQTLPGLNATNVAIIVGRKLRGPFGSLVAALGLILPGAAILCLLGILYMKFRNNPDVTAALAGVTAAAVGLLLQVTLKIGAKQFLSLKDLVFVIPTFLLVGVFHLSLLSALFFIAPLAIWMHRPKAKPGKEHPLPEGGTP